MTASTASAFVGTSVTLTIRPDDNYKLDTLTVKDADGAAVATNGTDDKITFTMPEKSVIVSATFVLDALKVPLTLEAAYGNVKVSFENMAAGPVTYSGNNNAAK